MKPSLLRLAFLVLVAAGCSDSTPPPTPNPDLSSTDLSKMIPPPTDGSGTKNFGDQCFVPGSPGDCAPGLICDMFVMNTLNRCTRMCDQNPNPTNCPPPSSGMCNGKGECKFTQ
jgi:hypothetical protein